MENQINLEVENIPLYGYKNNKGVVLWTSNEIFARVRSDFYGTNDIFIEKK